VQLDGLEIDVAERPARRDGEVLHLTPIEFKLLTVLAQNRGRLLTHNALLQQVWGPAYVDARQTLRAHIVNLRRKSSQPTATASIHTDHRVGYRLADLHVEPMRVGPPPKGEVRDREPIRSGGPTWPDSWPAARPTPARRPVWRTPDTDALERLFTPARSILAWLEYTTPPPRKYAEGPARSVMHPANSPAVHDSAAVSGFQRCESDQHRDSNSGG
jgi:hypothetical protein